MVKRTFTKNQYLLGSLCYSAEKNRKDENRDFYVFWGFKGSEIHWAKKIDICNGCNKTLDFT